MVVRRATFRLYPNKKTEEILRYHRKLHKDIYNAAIKNRKTQYEKFGHKVDYLEQQNSLSAFKEVWPEYKDIAAHALQATLKRVDFAYQRFFKGLGKYPKFKSIRHYSGWTYPDKQGWKVHQFSPQKEGQPSIGAACEYRGSSNKAVPLFAGNVGHSIGKNGYLELAKIGNIQMRGQARIWGMPTTCTIVHRHGKWYASITLGVLDELIQRPTGTGAVGIDIGCKAALAITDGENHQVIEAPQFLRKAEKQIKKVSKSKRRKQAPNRKKKIKASRRWKKAQSRVTKIYRKVANQRQSWVHKVATDIVSSNSFVATEKLEVKKMTRKGKKRLRQKAGLNKSILDVGFGMLADAIQYKVLEAGGMFVEVPTKQVKPSQTCPKCGHQQSKNLDERIHNCSNCGYIQDRDIAAALVMLLWAKGILPGFGTSLVDADVNSSTSKARKHTGSLKQLGQAKRQKSTLTGRDVETRSSTK